MTISFTISPLTPSDYLEAFAVSDLAFASINRLLHHIYPPSPVSKAKLAFARLATMPPVQSVRMFKAVDDQTKRIIGVSRWDVKEHDEESVQEEVDRVLRRAIPETNVEATRAYYTMVNEERLKILGVQDEKGDIVKVKKRVELEVLVTHPDFQRNGVGTALLQWGLVKADRLGLEVYVEATEKGRPLYARLGFQDVKVVEFDAGLYGGSGRCVATFMIRPVLSRKV